jgi:hypothetical protein
MADEARMDWAVVQCFTRADLSVVEMLLRAVALTVVANGGNSLTGGGRISAATVAELQTVDPEQHRGDWWAVAVGRRKGTWGEIGEGKWRPDAWARVREERTNGGLRRRGLTGQPVLERIGYGSSPLRRKMDSEIDLIFFPKNVEKRNK